MTNSAGLTGYSPVNHQALAAFAVSPAVNIMGDEESPDFGGGPFRARTGDPLIKSWRKRNKNETLRNLLKQLSL